MQLCNKSKGMRKMGPLFHCDIQGFLPLKISDCLGKDFVCCLRKLSRVLRSDAQLRTRFKLNASAARLGVYLPLGGSVSNCNTSINPH